MSLLDGMLGHASKIDPTEIQNEFSWILIPEETVEHVYQLVRDYYVFTNMRLVLVDKQGVSGVKVEYHSIPYKSITHFSVETAGTFDLDAELKIWLSGAHHPIQREFTSETNIYEVQTALASYVLGNKSARTSDSIQINNKKSKNNKIDELEFCFHCGETVNPNVKQCKSCGGSLI
jgi:hypothetical protein